MRENCTYSLSGGRWPARKRATSDPTPVNQPNKVEQSTAEVGEGRGRIKENTSQSHTLSTQDEVGVSQGLRGVRQTARERKRERFTALLHHLTIGLLRESFYALKRQGAPGVEGVKWREYETGLEDRLIDLHSRVHRGAYRAQPSRRVYYQYHAVPGNIATLGRFRDRLFWLWWKIVGRRSERRMRWDRYCSIFRRWVPYPRIVHP